MVSKTPQEIKRKKIQLPDYKILRGYYREIKRVKMNDPKKEFYKYLEAEIDELYEKLKPELKKGFVVSSTLEGDRQAAAKTYSYLNPPSIIFHINSLEETIRPQIIKELKKIFTHEIVHSFQGRIMVGESSYKELEAKEKEGKVNFFK